MADSEIWWIKVTTSNDTAGAFENALEPFCEAVSIFPAETGEGRRIEGFCTARPDPEALSQALSNTAAALGVEPPTAAVEVIAPRDWVTENLGTFPPVEIGRFFIYGTHHQTPIPAGRIGLCLNSAAAFGSGKHESTKGALLALDELVHGHSFRAPLDMGCGSGILALAIAKILQAPVVAADNDPRAITVTHDNAQLNQVGPLIRAVLSDGYNSPAIRQAAPFDLIVANILANPLCQMAADLERHLAKDGIAVLAGFLASDSMRLLSAHRHQGLTLMRRIDVGDWQTLILARDKMLWF